MQAAFEKIIEKLEEEKMSYFLTIANTGDEKLDYAYENVGNVLDDAIEIVKQEAEKFGRDTNVGSNGNGVLKFANLLKELCCKKDEDYDNPVISPKYLNDTIENLLLDYNEQYEECYKDCGDCEAYNKEKHHCPKFCKVIKETVKEIEENHNGWIPCSSGVLPKRSNSYCVTKMCENYGNPIYETCHEIFWTNDNKWDCERDEDCEWRVIAWKEKDKPYQPNGE